MIGVQGLRGLLFALLGGQKIVGTKRMLREFERFGYPGWFRKVTGVIQSVGALGLLGETFAPVFAVGGGLVIAVTMLGAVLAHLAVDDPVSTLVPPGCCARSPRASADIG